MDTLVSFINAATSGIISLALLGAILSSRVDDGIFIKIGLISMASGFGAIALCLIDGFAANDVGTFTRALLMINAGIAVAIIGYLLRRKHAHHELRRVTDFMSTEAEIAP